MRHRQRHAHATVVRHIREALTELGWVDEPVNFGTEPVTVIDYEPQQAGEQPAYNTVAISVDDQGPDEEFELGGLHSVRYTMFFDIYGISESIGIAIGDDIKDSLTYSEMSLLNFSDNPPTATHGWIEFEDVLVEQIPTATTTLDKRSWRAVKATAVCYF